MTKKKCILLLSRFPSPPLGGYKLKTYYFVKMLSEIYDLHIIVITDEKFEPQHKEFLDTHAEKITVFTPAKWKFYWNAMTGIFFSKNPIQVEYYYFKKIKQQIQPFFKETDIVISSLTRTVEYTKNIPSGIPVIFDEVDSYALSYTRSISKTKSSFWKLIYKIEARRLFKYEKEIVQRAKATLLVNEDETKYWNKYGNCFWLPNGVTPELLSYPIPTQPENAIGFFGKMNYQPNIDAVKWYCKNVVKDLPPGMKFYIIGVFPTKEITKLAEKYDNVVITGFMEDPYQLMSQCLAIVSPMQTGGGLQNKVLDGMALGKVNILSNLAAKPIGGKHMKEFIIADSAEKHLKSIDLILSRKEERIQIEKNAREFVRNKFSWENYKNQLIRVLK